MLNTSKYLFLPLFFLLTLVRGASLSETDLRRAAANWISGSTIFRQQFPVAEVERIEQVFLASQEALPLYVLHLRPAGYLVLTGDDTLPPVLAFSTRTQATNIPQREASPFLALLRLQGERYQQLLEEPQTRSEYCQKNLESWQSLLSAAVRAAPLEDPDEIVVEPLIEQPWDQVWPYNLYLPRSAEEIPAVTGCEPTAVALIMNFHQWPPRGKGSKSWTTVVTSEYNVGGQMNADFTVPYDWDRMMDSYPVLQSPPTVSELAVARLMFDLGVAFESFLGSEGTGTWSDKPVPAMEAYFGYSGLVQGESRSQTTLFQRIKDDVLAGFPVHASIPGHSFVVSGLATYGSADYYYLNYGWGGYLSGWYRLNDGDEDSVIYSAITHFLPAKKAMLGKIPSEQPGVFELQWDFPRIHSAEAFRLSVMRDGNTTVISDQISGAARAYPLSNEPVGSAEYFLEAKVGGVWQAKSDALQVKIVEEPAPVPEFVIDQDIVFLRQGGTVLITLLLHHPEDTLSVSCSRPDLYPADQIRISGEGTRRDIRLIPADNSTGNAMLHVTAKNSAELTYTCTVSMIWNGLNWLEALDQAKNQAAEEGKKIFLVIGQDEDWYTAELRHMFCEISDIRAKLQNEYVLCYLRSLEQVSEWFGGGSYSLPLTAILQNDEGAWEPTFRNNPEMHGQLSPGDLRNLLPVGPLQVQPSIQEVSYQAQSVFVRVLADGPWEISSNSDFLQPKRSSGSGNATVECILQENAGEQERVADLTVSSGGVESIGQILQHGRILLEVTFAVAEKEYDGTILAEFEGEPTLTGISPEHDVQVDFSGAWLEFSDAEPGVDKVVKLYGAVLFGNDADLYQLAAENNSVGTIMPNQTTIPTGWNTITLLLEPDDQSRQLWTSALLVFEYQNRCFVRVGLPQAGKTYVIYNGSGAELQLTGKKWLGGQAVLPSTPGWTLQSITEETALPSGMDAWLLLDGKYLRILDNLAPGEAYWLHP